MKLKITDKQDTKISNNKFECKISSLISIPEDMQCLLACKLKLASANKGLTVGIGQDIP